ncbi:MAG: hypothetical protein NTV22_15930 [bacterium]|nr:hypothetical protein [bacterium]
MKMAAMHARYVGATLLRTVALPVHAVAMPAKPGVYLQPLAGK